MNNSYIISGSDDSSIIISSFELEKCVSMKIFPITIDASYLHLNDRRQFNWCFKLCHGRSEVDWFEPNKKKLKIINWQCNSCWTKLSITLNCCISYTGFSKSTDRLHSTKNWSINWGIFITLNTTLYWKLMSFCILSLSCYISSHMSPHNGNDCNWLVSLIWPPTGHLCCSCIKRRSM